MHAMIKLGSSYVCLQHKTFAIRKKTYKANYGKNKMPLGENEYMHKYYQVTLKTVANTIAKSFPNVI